MPTRHPTRHAAGLRRPAARGFSLIELMVSVTLGLIVVLAVSLVFLGTRQTSRTTESLSRVQESARTLFDLMSRELREAGGTPCDNGLRVANVLNAFQTAPALWWSDWGQVLQGYDGAAVAPGATFGGGTGQRVAGTSAVTLKFVADLSDLTVTAHDTAAANFTVNNSPHRVAAGDVLMACTYGQGAIFAASSVTANGIAHATGAGSGSNCTTGLGLTTVCTPTGNPYAFVPGSKIGRLVAATWFIGNNGRASTGGRSLYRASRLGVEEVAEGVLDMQVTYLVDGAVAYVNAAAVADWSTVVAIRVALTLDGADTGASTRADGRLQRPFGFTLNVRNRQP